MRRLHPVSHPEQMVAQGEYVYLRDGQPTGTVEEWELTRLPDGSRIYRVEVGASDELWHLILAPDRRPDRLQVRLREEGGRRFDATYTFFDDEVMIAGGQVRERPVKNFVDLPPGFGLLWVPMAGRELSLLAYDPDAGDPQTVMLYVMHQRSPEEDWLSARPVRFAVERLGRDTLEVLAGSFEAEKVRLTVPGLADQQGWFDRHGTVLQWQSGDQTQAVLSRYRRFN